MNAPAVNDTVIARINELSEWLSERGAVLLVAGCHIGKEELTVPEEEFIEAQNMLKEGWSCPFISDYRDYMFDYRLFYDSNAHLTTEGVELRTQQLIEDLQQWMELNADS